MRSALDDDRWTSEQKIYFLFYCVFQFDSIHLSPDYLLIIVTTRNDNLVSLGTMQMCYFKNSWMILMCSDGCKPPTWTRFEKDNFKLHSAPAVLQLRIQVSGEIAKGQDKGSIYLKVKKAAQTVFPGPCLPYIFQPFVVSFYLAVNIQFP